MPVIIEDGSGISRSHTFAVRGQAAGGSGVSGGTSGWDVNAAETLFWESVPIRLKLGGQDNRIRDLSFRIMLLDNTAKGVPKVRPPSRLSASKFFFANSYACILLPVPCACRPSA
jgi:hypothetical protein